jgi:hypothetical protein
MPTPKVPSVDFVILISESGSEYTATISPQPRKAKRGEGVRWFIDQIPKGFPKSTIFVQFNDKGKQDVNGPLDDGNMTGGRYNASGRVIIGVVGLGGNSCDYSLYYEEPRQPRKLLCDPELVIDGNRLTPSIVKLMKAERSELQRLTRVLQNKKKRKAKKR